MSNERDHATDRRDFLRTTSLVAIAAALGCSKQASPAEIEAAIRRFILAVGPWTAEQRDAAEGFATRFLVTDSGATSSLPFSRLQRSSRPKTRPRRAAWVTRRDIVLGFGAGLDQRSRR